jgi:16S rRNA (guanine527-N7)-methyltransferase
LRGPGDRTGGGNSFAGFDLPGAILRQAESCGLELADEARLAIEAHARELLRRDPELGLTSIRDPATFVERHIGESLAGAALLPAGIRGPLLDLGSGNGYPGLPLAAARPLLEPFLAEASSRKARFLREVLNTWFRRGAVIEKHVERAADVCALGSLRVVVTRAMGGWEKIVPRLVPAMGEETDVLIWAGVEAQRVFARSAWRKLELCTRTAPPGRDRSWIWRLRVKGPVS